MTSSKPSVGSFNPNAKLLEIEREQWRRECRRRLLPWCIEERSGHDQAPARHHRLLIDHLEGVASGQIKRLMIFMPPGSAKSTYTTVLTPPHLFARFPGCQIIGSSHTSDLAEDFSGRIQNVIRENQGTLGYGLKTESRGRWYTTNGGCYLAAGVGAALPGFRADCGIIDDPVKGRQAADSEAERNRIWNWYLGDFERRLTPDAPVILMHTRWSEDDLAGRLLATQADRWTVLRIPAEAEEDDPLGREPGEWLWNDDSYGYGASLAEIKSGLEAAGATREWASQYQQRPRPQEGTLFKVARIAVLDAAPSGTKIVRAWDLAATRAAGSRDPDWTAGVKLLRTSDNGFVVLDVVRVRGTPDEIEQTIVNTAAQDGRTVRIGLPQDPGQAGKAQVLYLTRKLAGFHVDSSPETGDKATRAGPVASQVNVGNVSIISGSWNRAFLDEIAAFPAGSKDDQVDALSRAFSMLDHARGTVFTAAHLARLQGQLNTRPAM